MLRFASSALVLVLTGGCWTAHDVAPTAPAAPAFAPPAVDIVAIHETTLSFVQTSARGLVEQRSVTLPTSVSQLRFADKDPVVLMLSEDRTVAQVWRVTATGHAALAIPDLASWPAVDTTNFDHFDTPEWELVTTIEKDVWLGRCEWGYMGEGSSCTQWVYMRLAPDPVVSSFTEPKHRSVSLFSLDVPAPQAAKLAVTLVNDPKNPDPDAYKDRHIAQCVRDGRTREYPIADERDPGNGFYDIDQLQWLQTEPAMWMIRRSDACMDLCMRTVIFEGCRESKRFEAAQLVEGPENVFALATPVQASVRWRGKQLGLLEAEHVAFVPR